MAFSPFARNIRQSLAPGAMAAAAFAAVIFAGTLALWLPGASRAGLSFLEAFFTATSAVCVTGLTVVDTATAFTPLGHAILLALMEAGGLGIMTIAAFGFWSIGRRLPFSHQAALDDALYQRGVGGQMPRITRRIVTLALSIQAAGAAAMFPFLLSAHGAAGDGRGPLFAAWSAVFHTVSAFCNAGFSLYPDGLAWAGFPGGVAAVMVPLALLGGLGHMALHEFREIGRRLRRGLPPRAHGIHWLSLHTRVVLWVTLGLTAGGGALLWALTAGRGGASAGDAWFLASAGRTSGFSALPMDSLPLAAALLLTGLMFVGGSPGSCAGGIKTTSLAIWFGRLWASLRSEHEVAIAGYAIPPELVWKSGMIVGLATIWNLAGVFLLSVTESAPLSSIWVEQVSAFATAGLTMGITADLSFSGKIWIMLSMFVGRVGPLTILFWVAHTHPKKYRLPLGRVMVG